MSRPERQAAGGAVGALLASARAAYAAGQYGKVRECCEAILASTGNAEAEHYLGLMDYFAGDAPSGERHIRAALSRCGDNPVFHNILGLCLRRQGRSDEAVASFRQALRLDAGYFPAWGNLALELSKLGMLDDALAAFDQVLAMQPNSPQARFGRSQILLAQGDFARGWPEHEWRLACPEYGHKYALPPRVRALPRWQGQNLVGKSLLLVSEQGIGDTVQFIRYARILGNMADRVSLYLRDPNIRALLEGVDGIGDIHIDPDALPAHDYFVYLMSLPSLLGTVSIRDVPAECPYLSTDPARGDCWRELLSGLSGSMKVGLAWSGNPKFAHDANRSCPFDALRKLFDLPVTWVNLQLAAPMDQGLLDKGVIVDYSARFTNYAETAALMAQLDLVVSVDTSIAHVAGALGVPVWIMLGKPADWRWQVARADSPWYPTARLFRQERSGDWEGVVAAIHAAFLDLAARARR